VGYVQQVLQKETINDYIYLRPMPLSYYYQKSIRNCGYADKQYNYSREQVVFSPRGTGTSLSQIYR
jgi:hypothetical protein